MDHPELADPLLRLSLADKIGQVLSVAWGRHGALALTSGSRVDTHDEIQQVVIDLGIGGVCYFPSKPEGDTEAEVAAGLAELQRLAVERTGIGLLTSTDQEGGRVARLRRGYTAVPSARELGSDPGRVREYALVSGTELARTGINMVFAPVADVDSNPDNPVIADRSFSADPDQVARCVTAAIEGYHQAGITCVAKHFPGHGDTNVDSHQDQPSIDRSLEGWRRLEAVPFRAAVEAGVDAIMLGHLVFPALDDQMATVSAGLVDLVRGELGFDGLLVTDALEMQGATKGRDPGQLVVDSLAAGIDQLLIPADNRVAHAALVAAVEDGRLSRQRVDDACRRVLAVKARTTPA